MNSQKRRKFWGNMPKYKMPKTNDGAPTSNRFHLLSEDEDEEVVKKERIPPIIVDSNFSFGKVLGMLGEKYKYKRMSIGTKIMPSSMAMYNAAVEALKKCNVNFYSHEVKNNNIFKMVIFGLPRFSNDVIKDEFMKTHNITPVSVKEIVTKRSNEDDVLYLIEFDRQHVSKREVLKIKYFSNISVYWRRPYKGNKGPTQCTKCAMFGHGAKNCNRVKVCAACSGSHEYVDCPLNKSSPDGSIVYKCHNCLKKNYRNINHRADDPKCPCRREYIEIRQRLTSKTRIPDKRHNSNFIMDDSDFPQLTKQERPGNSHNFLQGIKLFSDVSKGKVRDNNDDLSNEKLLEIFFDAVDALEKCQTKFDKLRVLGMMLKHAI